MDTPRNPDIPPNPERPPSVPLRLLDVPFTRPKPVSELDVHIEEPQFTRQSPRRPRKGSQLVVAAAVETEPEPPELPNTNSEPVLSKLPDRDRDKELVGEERPSIYQGAHDLDIFGGAYRRESLVTPLGNRLDVTVEANRVLIRTNTRHHFSAFFDSNSSVFSFSVNNLGLTGQRHPEVYPTKLVSRSIDYFQDISGQQVSCLLGEWITDAALSDNYAEYLQNLTVFGDNPSPEEQAIAALNTWTGRLAQKLGFKTVLSVTQLTPGTLNVHFFKEPKN